MNNQSIKKRKPRLGRFAQIAVLYAIGRPLLSKGTKSSVLTNGLMTDEFIAIALAEL